MARLRFGLMRKCNTTLLSLYCLSLMGNSSRWAVWLGHALKFHDFFAPKGTLPVEYRKRPKVFSFRSEIRIATLVVIRTVHRKKSARAK